MAALLLAAKTGAPAIPVQEKRLYRDVQVLTAIDPPRNYRHTDALDRAADYIFKEFRQCGCRVEFQEFQARGDGYRNVIASFAVDKRVRLVIGAHYDVCGDQPGADDNASGAAAILELARLLEELRPNLKYRVDLVAYTLEEPPFFRTGFMGSAVHARSLTREKVKVKLMVSLDMIGFFAGKNVTAVVGRAEQKGIVRRVKKLMTTAAGIEVIPVIAPPSRRGIDFSDHLNYWNQDFPAVMVTNYFTSHNPNYHSPRDTIDTLDFRKLAEVVTGIYRLVTNLE